MSRPAANGDGGDGREQGSLPLADVKVLDLSRLLPGPFCSLLLADLGADVLKVEDTGLGDYVRWAPPYYGDDEISDTGTRGAMFLALNRNKRSMRLNLKTAQGQEILLKLVKQYDVLLESFRPGVLDKLGVGYDRLQQENPRLVYCAITGYGQDGPLRDRAGHDMNYLALNGLLGMTGQPDGAPVQAAGQIADIGGGAQMAAIGILAALREKDRSGQGQLVDISMTDGALSWLAMPASRVFAGEQGLQRGMGELSGGYICYRPYEAADGWVALGALEPKFWQAWCDGVGREDLIEKQFDPPGSPAHADVEAVFKARTRNEWTTFAAENDCCLEPILELGEALDSELVADRKMVIEIDQPQIGSVKQIGNPIKLSRTARTANQPAPAIGEHTGDVLSGLGLADDEIASLREQGVI